MGGFSRTGAAGGPSRLRVLRPLFTKIHEWNARIPGAAEERPATILIGSHRLAVEPWERGEIARWPSAAADDPAARRCGLVMEALACMAKTMGDIERCGSASAGSRQQAELMLDGAIGMAVLQDVQGAIDHSVERGALDEAKEWGSLQHRLHRTVKWALQPIAEADRARVKDLAASLTDSGAGETRRSAQPETAAEAGPRPDSRSTSSTEPEADAPCEFWCEELLAPESVGEIEPVASVEVAPGVHIRTKMLAAACALSVSLWAAVVWLPRAIRDDPKPAGMAEILDAASGRAILDRPPGLYVDVSGADWDGLTHVEKWRRIERVADLVEPHGYDGVLFRDDSGRPLAQWLRGRGITLLGSRVGPASRRTPLRPE